MAGRVARGAGWVAAGRIGTQAVQFVSGLALARLLTPADFGVIASVYVIYGFTLLFFELGIGQSLIYLRDLTEDDLATAFWINALGGVVLAVLLAAAAPLVAAFFSEPDLLYLTPLVALGFTLSLGICNRALLERELQFRWIALLEIGTATLGFSASIAAALAGAGVYALAIGPLLHSASMSIGLFAVVPWRPKGFIVRASVRRLWRFSGGLLGFNVVNFWARNADNLLIGRFLGAAPLGFYSRAYNLMLLPVTQVSQVLGRVMFPALAAMHDDRGRVAAAYRRALKLINAIAVPILVGMAATAPGLVPLLWGGAWDETIPLLQVLCIAGVPQCMQASAGWLYQSQGRTGTMFRMGLVESSVAVIAMAVGLHWGAIGVAVAVALRAWLFTPITLYIPCRMIGLSAGRVLLDCLPTILVAALMGAIVWLTPVALGVDRDTGWVVAIQVLAGAAAVLLGLRIAQPAVLQELRNMSTRRRRQAVSV
jgi:O-antigen/teichoic acid export membrane protein